MSSIHTHGLLEQFLSFFSREQIRLSKPLLLAVSGGLDSVVLAELCKRAGFPFAIAHCNFGLRGEESDRDASFVRSLSEKYEVKLHLHQFETAAFAEAHQLSIQEAARELRYSWFEQLLAKEGYAYVVLAHHADDNVETLLMHFFRGTGLKGLTGMPQKTKTLLRPLLQSRRFELEQFARDHGLSWVEDSSNQTSDYTRNYFRNELLPAIRRVYPEADENLLANIRRLGQVERFYRQSMDQTLATVAEQRNGEVWVPVRKLKKYDYRLLIFELIKGYGFGEKQVEEVVKLMDSPSGKFIANNKFQIIRHGLWMVIAPLHQERSLVTITEDDTEIKTGTALLALHYQPAEGYRIRPEPEWAQLDREKLEFPLVLRRWKAGDYFYPLGMQKKKKVARFLIDRKLPRHLKEKQLVLESNKKIVWVVGHRIDDRFKISPSTKKLLLITYQDQVL